MGLEQKSFDGKPGFLITKVDALLNAARKCSIWPNPFGTACCAIEMMAVYASRFDLGRFGAEKLSFTPRQADLMIVAGRVPIKLMHVMLRIWQQMPEPKWAISMGACASTGGVFDNYAVVQGIDQFIPVDVYIPGCPPRPEQLVEGLMKIQKIMEKDSIKTRGLIGKSKI